MPSSLSPNDQATTRAFLSMMYANFCFDECNTPLYGGFCGGGCIGTAKTMIIEFAEKQGSMTLFPSVKSLEDRLPRWRHTHCRICKPEGFKCRTSRPWLENDYAIRPLSPFRIVRYPEGFPGTEQRRAYTPWLLPANR